MPEAAQFGQQTAAYAVAYSQFRFFVMAAALDELPPLEDMEEALSLAAGLRARLRPAGEASEPKAAASAPPPAQKAEQPRPAPRTAPATDSGAFGGLAAGFLLDRKPKAQPQAQPKAPPQPQLTTLKPQVQPLRLPEVQASLDAERRRAEQATSQWLNEDLLKELAKNPKLMRGLADPRVAAVMAEFQRAPREAARKYADNAELSEFIREFAAVMSKHFAALTGSEGGTAPAAAAADGDGADTVAFGARRVPKRTLQRWLSDPAVRHVLEDPATGELLARIGNDPEALARHCSDPRIAILLRAGVIQPPCNSSARVVELD